MIEPTVGIGLRKGRLFATSKYSPGPGTYVGKHPVFEAASDDSNVIGCAVLDAFKHFTVGGEIPDWNKYRAPVLDAAGVTTWSEYQGGLKDCSISCEEDRYHIYTELPHIYLPLDATPEEIGHAILTALGTTADKEAKKAARRTRNEQE